MTTRSRRSWPVFGFALSFGAYSREQAYRVAVASLAHTLRLGVRSEERGFLEALFRSALEELGKTPPAGITDLSAFGPLVSAQPPSLAVARQALLQLSSDEKAVLLLRDQAHLSFDRIGLILGKGERETRSSCLAAREKLRARVKQVLDGGAKNDAV
jgi:DNA-directed RNA polymerase specialized sigma24 family protein